MKGHSSVRKREHDPRHNRGLVGSIAASWIDEQKVMPRSGSAHVSTYSGVPRAALAPTSMSEPLQNLDGDDNVGAPFRNHGSSEVKLSRNMRLQNIGMAVKQLSEPEIHSGSKESSKSNSMARKMRRSVKSIFSNKAEITDTDLDDDMIMRSDSNRDQEEEATKRESLVVESSLRGGSGRANHDVNGRVPLLAGARGDSARIGRLVNRNGGETARRRGKEDGMDRSTRIRSRSEGMIGRLRRRNAERRERKGTRSSVSPKRSSAQASPMKSRSARISSGGDVAPVSWDTLEPSLNKMSARIRLDEARMASEVFNRAKQFKENEDKSLSNHSSRAGSEGSLRGGSRVTRLHASEGFDNGSSSRSSGLWSANDEGSSRQVGKRTEVLQPHVSTGSLPPISEFRSRPVCDSSHIVSRLNRIADAGDMEASNSSLPPLLPLGAIPDSPTLQKGGAPYVSNFGRAMNPFHTESVDNSWERRDRHGSHNRQEGTKTRRTDIHNSSDPHMKYSPHGNASKAKRGHKDPTENSENPFAEPRARLQRGKMSASDQTHEVRRTRLAKDESSPISRHPAERNGSEKQNDKPRSSADNHSSRRSKGTMGVSDSRRTSRLPKSNTDSISNHKSSKPRKRSHSLHQSRKHSDDSDSPVRRKSDQAKGHKQRTKSKEDPSMVATEAGRKKSSRKVVVNNSQGEKEKEVTSDAEVNSVLWSGVDSSPGPLDPRMQMALNPGNAENSELPQKALSPDVPTQPDNNYDETVQRIPRGLNPSDLANVAPPTQSNGLAKTKLIPEAMSVASPSGESSRRCTYHPRTIPLEQAAAKAAQVMSRSEHGGKSERRRSNSLPPKGFSKTDRSDSSRRKKKKTVTNGAIERKDLNGEYPKSLDPGQEKPEARTNDNSGTEEAASDSKRKVSKTSSSTRSKKSESSNSTRSKKSESGRSRSSKMPSPEDEKHVRKKHATSAHNKTKTMKNHGKEQPHSSHLES